MDALAELVFTKISDSSEVFVICYLDMGMHFMVSFINTFCEPIANNNFIKYIFLQIPHLVTLMFFLFIWDRNKDFYYNGYFLTLTNFSSVTQCYIYIY